MSLVDESEQEEQKGPLTGEELETMRALIRRVRQEHGYWDRYNEAPKPRYGSVSELGESSDHETEEQSEEQGGSQIR